MWATRAVFAAVWALALPQVNNGKDRLTYSKLVLKVAILSPVDAGAGSARRGPLRTMRSSMTPK